MLPGGESPGEAFNRVFSEYVDKGTLAAAAGMGGGAESEAPITKVTTTNTSGDVTETTYKTNTINQGANNTGGVVINNIDNSSNNSSTKSSNTTISNTPLDTGIDGYYDRQAWADVSP